MSFNDISSSKSSLPGPTQDQTMSKGWYLTEAEKLEERWAPLSPPATNEVQIKIKSVALNVQDQQYYRKGGSNDIGIGEPLVLGQEGAGIVVAVGPGVKNLKQGDRVAINGDVPCGQCDCDACSDEIMDGERFNLCPHLKVRGTVGDSPPFQGLFQEYVNHPAQQVSKLDDNMSFQDAALVYPLACTYHAIMRGAVKDYHSVAIYGAGVMGCLVAAALKQLGCPDIILLDSSEERLNFAMKHDFGTADGVIKTNGRAGFEIIKSSLEGKLADVVFECSGADSALAEAVKSVKPGRKVVVIGHHPSQNSPSLHDFGHLEIDVRSAYRHEDHFLPALRLIRESLEDSAKLSLSALITHTFKGFESVPEALKCAVSGETGEVSKAPVGPEGIYRLRVEF